MKKRRDPPLPLPRSVDADRLAQDEAQIARYLATRSVTRVPDSRDPAIDEAHGPLVWDQAKRRLTRDPTPKPGRPKKRSKMQRAVENHYD